LLVTFVGLRIDLFDSPKAIFNVAWGNAPGDEGTYPKKSGLALALRDDFGEIIDNAYQRAK